MQTDETHSAHYHILKANKNISVFVKIQLFEDLFTYYNNMLLQVSSLF